MAENLSVDERLQYGKKAGIVGIIFNVILCGGKFAAGIVSGSLSITADAVNNLSDASSAVISLLGFKLSEKSADKEHPYGHGRYEYLAGFVVAAAILAIGFELLQNGIRKIIQPAPVEFGIVTAVVLAVSIAAKIGLMCYYRTMGRKIGSDTLIASAADSRNDAISTSAVLAAMIAMHVFRINLDGIMSVLVAVFVMISGVGLIREAMNPLLGKAPKPEQVEKIRQQILAYDRILGTHDLMIHDYGVGRQFASVHVEVAENMPLVECHELIDRIEQDFLAEGLPMIIHPDPIVTDSEPCSEFGKIHAALSEILGGIDERITIHDMRIVSDMHGKKVCFDCVVPPDLTDIENTITQRVNEGIAQRFSNYACQISFDSGFASVPRLPENDKQSKSANHHKISKENKENRENRDYKNEEK